jgi:glycosyltransferase involved in cell wall biosynthesis
VHKSLAIISTHPIQYNAPLFRYLASIGKFNLKVFYTWGENSIRIYDPGFGKERSWDVDLLSGYDHTFVNNVSVDPGSHHYKGIINPDLIQLVTAYNPDAILMYGWKFHSHLQLMRSFKGKIPIIFRGDSTLQDETKGFSIKKWGRQQLLKWVYKHVDNVLSPGSASDEYFQWVGLKPSQINRARHAVENERFMGEMGDGRLEMENKAKKWRQELGIKDDKKVFLFAGKFEPKKDPLLLLQSFKQLLPKRADIHLIMVGNGILEEQIKNEISNSQFPVPISLLPFQNQSLMPIVYRLGDVFVLPSKGPGETWGLAINEAMASGRLVIASDKCGGSKDLIIDNHNGFIFRAGDQQDLLNKMETILNANIQTMGENARAHIRQFNYDDFAKALDGILK